MIKRTFILILIISIAASSILPTMIFAEDSEVKDELFETKVSVIRLVYPEYPLLSVDSTVTRGEFSVMLAGLFGIGFPSGEEQLFFDLTYDNPAAPSVKFLVKMGIVSQNELFYPNEPIQYKQAVKMAVAAAGYAPQAEAMSGYPFGYLRVASSLKLDKGINSESESIKYGDITILLYNLLHCNVYDLSQTNNDTFLYHYHKINEATGIVTANGYGALTDSNVSVARGKLAIDSLTYTIYDDKYSDYLGYKVKYYYRSAGSERAIIYMYKYDCKEVSLLSSEIYEVEDYILQTDINGENKKYRLDRSYVYIKNGKQRPVKASDQSSLFTMDSGMITLVDNDSDGRYDIVNVREYRYNFISSVDPFHLTISDQNTSDSYIDLSDSECVYHIYDFTADGYKPISLSDLGKDMLIAFTVSDDKKLYNIFVCNEKLEGKLEAVDRETGEIYVNGKKYNTNKYYNSYFSDIAIGKEAVFYLGMDGSAAVAFSKSESGFKYGWIVACANNRNDLKKNAQIKIFSQDGIMVEADLADKLTINGSSKSSDDVCNIIDGLSDEEKLVKYSVNKQNAVNKIILSEDAKTDTMPGAAYDNESDFVKYISKDSGALSYRSSTSIFYSLESGSKTSFRVDSSTYSFVIPKTERNTEDNYAVYSPESFVDGIEYNISAYDLDKSSLAGATLCFDESAPDKDAVGTLIVERVSDSLNPDGEEALAVEGYCFANNVRKFVTYYSSPKTYNDILKLHAGDLVRMSVNKKGIATSVIRDFDIENYALGSMVDSVGGNSEYICGLLYNYSNGYMSIFTDTQVVGGYPKVPDKLNRDNLINLSVSSNSIMFVDLKRTPDGSGVKRVAVRHSNLEEINDYNKAGSAADYVVARRYQSGRSYCVVVYKIY